MFSDPWIIGFAGVCLTIIGIAALFRLYNWLKAKVAKDAAKSKSA